MGRRKQADVEKVEFSGDLTCGNAGDVKNLLANALQEASLEISFGEVKEVDLSFLQLLCSALRTAAESSRSLTVAAGAVPESVSSLVTRAGMVSPVGRGDDTFWQALAGGNGHG